MKERPILFSAQMVRAILEGRKTQTRRVMKPQPEMVSDHAVVPWDGDPATLQRLLFENGVPCPYGQRGDLLWVREAHAYSRLFDWMAPREVPPFQLVSYRASMTDQQWHDLHAKTRVSIHMPRWASRITLRINSVRVERLNQISEEDAEREGAKRKSIDDSVYVLCSYKHAFKTLWESINGPGSWAANPWVWVIEFDRVCVGGEK